MSERSHRVLVVDDHEANVDLLCRRLERRGYETVAARSGPEALERIEKERFDLVLLDVMMPGMSGLEVLEAIRRTRSADVLPVIMATAKSGSNDVVEALDAGANDFVTKPIDVDVLLARIRVHLRSASTAPPERVRPAEGVVLERKYELEERIGVGGFGTVYRAKHLSLEKHVAVKILHEHLLESERAVSRFAREGVSACRVQHPNAVAVLDAGTTSEGLPYLVMELLEGHSLDDELDQHAPLRLARCVSLLRPLCDALSAAHAEGIVHRDVKPANVMISRGPAGEEVVKVLDFGIAKLVESHAGGPATLDEIAGTPQYMAPERLLGEPSDHRADIYSVGVTTYVMLTGDFPFTYTSKHVLAQAVHQIQATPRPLRLLRQDLPAEAEEIVMAAIARSPLARPELDALADTLEELSSRWREDDSVLLHRSRRASALGETEHSIPRRAGADEETREPGRKTALDDSGTVASGGGPPPTNEADGTGGKLS